MNLDLLYFEDKFFLTVVFIVASAITLFLNPKANHKAKPWPLFYLYHGPLFKEDGTMRKYSKIGIVIFLLSWIPFIWVYG
ncbi:MAG: hypothetical protein KJO26_05480, partial [Deltaproteobacteria bacterium]|nr:hypothetical protein [Deltaproteobacteria bacterium]